jgi:hypothetical protein
VQKRAVADAGNEAHRHAPWRAHPIAAKRHAEHLPDGDQNDKDENLIAVRPQ